MKQGLYYDGTNYEKFKVMFLEYFDANCLCEIWRLMEDEGDKFLDEDEKFKIETEEINSPESSGYHKQLGTTRYYVNIKKITLICLQIFAEMTIQANLQNHALKEQSFPVLPTIMQLKKCFGKLKEENGELCIATEIGRSREAFTGWKSFTNNRNECVNNCLTCSYNQDGYCLLDQDMFDRILEMLVEKNVIYKKNNRYKVSF